MKETRFADLMAGLLFIILGILLFLGAGRLQPVKLGIGPAGFPRFISVFMELLGIGMTVSVLRKGMPKPKITIGGKAVLLLTASIALSALYVVMVTRAGFLLCTPVLLFGMMMLYGNRRYLLCAAISLCMTVAVWLLFTKVFYIFLPTGSWLR